MSQPQLMEFLPNELHSDDIVAAMRADTAQRIATLQLVYGVTPGLELITNNPSHEPSLKYMGMKKSQASEVGMNVAVRVASNPSDIIQLIEEANEDPNVHGILPQFPLLSPSGSGEVVNDRERLDIVTRILPEKDIDGVNPNSGQESATMRSIVTLLEHYGILEQDSGLIAIIGKGLLVGLPMYEYLKKQGFDVLSFDKESSRTDLYNALRKSKTMLSASGNQSVLKPIYFPNDSPPKTLIDAGSAEKGGHGDVSKEMRDFANSEGWRITPRTHGVGPGTVQCAMAATVTSAERSVDNSEPTRDFLPKGNYLGNKGRVTTLPPGWPRSEVADYPRHPEILDADYLRQA